MQHNTVTFPSQIILISALSDANIFLSSCTEWSHISLSLSFLFYFFSWESATFTL